MSWIHPVPPNKGLQLPSARFGLSTTGSVWHHTV